MQIDLNSDLGEGFGPWRMGDDAAMLDVVTSANIACGGHASDPETMFTTLSAAAALKSTEVALLGPILGWLVDRFGAGRVMLCGVFGWSAACLGAAFSHTFGDRKSTRLNSSHT